MPTISGDFSSPTGRFAIVVARFNELITHALEAGAREMLERHGVSDDRIDIIRVPGSFEIPVTARALTDTGRYSAIICLGCVIRGETAHFDYVAGQAAAGLMQAAVTSGIPVIFGVLTTDTVEQALNRAGLKSGNKGAEAALAAIEMVNLFSKIRSTEKGSFGFGTPAA